MKNLLLFLLTLLLLSACSDNSSTSEVPDTKEGNSVFLKISSQQTGKTRSDEASATGTRAELLSALIYFLDGSSEPVIYATRTVGSAGEDLTVAQLEAGYLFEGIPSQVTQVYVVGNYNSSYNGDSPVYPGVGQTLQEVKNVVLNIQQVSFGTLVNGTRPSSTLITVMDGISQIQNYDSNPGGWNGDNTPDAGSQYADVIISPVVARIEIERITYEGNFMSFELEGIYINYYYATMPLGLDTDGFAVTNNGSNTDLYDRNSGDYAYEDYSTLDDPIRQNGTVGSVFTPSNGVWAYQVFGNSDPVPHIILKLTGVVDGDGNYVGDRYVTVTGFMNGNTPVTTFARNTIYKIEDLAFNDSDTSLIPEPDTINLWVHVSVAPWITVIVTPVID